MSDLDPPPRIRFTLNGARFDLSRDSVGDRLRDVTPEPVRKHGVRINGVWFPVMQAFEVATGVSRREFISHTARRHLAALGYEVHGEIDHRTANTSGGDQSPPQRVRADGHAVESPVGSSAPVPGAVWHTEANVQASLVSNLVRDGWRILSVADTATKQRGVDVVAARDGDTVGVEVKGFPERTYADPARAGESKRTAPSTQAGHWYAQAVLAAMRLRTRRPDLRSIIALPDFPRYRDLHAETSQCLDAAQISVWWVRNDGSLEQPS